MHSRELWSAVVLVSLTAFSVAGCQPVGDAIIAPAVEEAGQGSVAKDLGLFYTVYMEHHDVHAKGPAGWDEMLTWTGDREAEAAAIGRLRDLGYQVTWGASLRDATQGSMNTVLAQSPGNPTLMLDGTVSQ